MMKCFDCETEFQPGARFCSNCGRNFRAAKGNRRQKPPEAVGGHQKPPEAADPQGSYPHSESIDAWYAFTRLACWRTRE